MAVSRSQRVLVAWKLSNQVFRKRRSRFGYEGIRNFLDDIVRFHSNLRRRHMIPAKRWTLNSMSHTQSILEMEWKQARVTHQENQKSSAEVIQGGYAVNVSNDLNQRL
jgi:hypothetical protein